jgi:ABC-type branched-subunit amino acid transport system substrate-binding protein
VLVVWQLISEHGSPDLHVRVPGTEIVLASRRGAVTGRRIRTGQTMGAVIALLVAGTVLGACGSSSHSASAPTTTGGSTGATTQGTTAGSTAGSTGGTASAQGTFTGHGCQGSPTTGITSKTITLGLVTDLSGPISDIYSSAADTINAFVKYTNANGGVGGRTLVLKTLDDGLNPTQDAAATRSLSTQVFAFLGNLSGAEGGGIPFINRACIPDIGSASTQPRREEPTYAHLGSQSTSVSNNVAKYAASLGVKSMAFLAFNDPSAIAGSKAAAKAFNSVGVSTCYFAAVGFSQANYTANVLQMKNNGCQGLSLELTESVGATVLQEFAQQGYHPKFTYFNTTEYVNGFTSLAGGTANTEGIYLPLNTAPVDESSPAMDLFKTTLHQYYPNADPHGLNAVNNWADAMTFVKALNMAGPNPTRVSVMNALAQIRNYDAGGIVPAQPSPVSRTLNPCTVILKMHDGQWQRAYPSQGFDCTGQTFS